MKRSDETSCMGNASAVTKKRLFLRTAYSRVELAWTCYEMTFYLYLRHVEIQCALSRASKMCSSAQ